jgi:formylglycine-generating enzyme required for sulfatase activity/uncharacterized caspase-like protein
VGFALACKLGFLFCALLLASAAALAADRRVALVVGVASYVHAPKLANPANDAALIAPELKRLGFEVEIVIDPDKSRLERAIRDFGNRLIGAKTGLFFYSGHGLQVDGRNYLVPASASLASEKDVRWETVDIDQVMQEMSAPDRVSLLFLDACRDNPFARSLASAAGVRSAAVGRGLAPAVAGSGGTLIAFATAPGNVAADGNGRDSPFTRALARHIGDKGQDVSLMLRRVKREVSDSTNGAQVPWVNENLSSEVYLAPPDAPSPAAPPAAANHPPGQAEVALPRPQTGSPKVAAPAHASAPAAPEPAPKAADLAIPEPTVVASVAHPPIMLPVTRPSGEDKERAEHCTTGVICPELVLIPHGRFVMGTTDAELGRELIPPQDAKWLTREKPQHPVVIAKDFWMAKYPVTVGEFRAFVKATGSRPSGPCRSLERENNGKWVWADRDKTTWESPGWQQTDRHPVVCVSATDAMAYIAWLNAASGTNAYRLPTEAEWEYAARAGTTTARYWGDDLDRACQFANLSDKSLGKIFVRAKLPVENFVACDDGFEFTAPVGLPRTPNPFGLFDMLGNVWQWVGECWHGDYTWLMDNGNFSMAGTCQERVIRGGSWHSRPWHARAGSRSSDKMDTRTGETGFRLARNL